MILIKETNFDSVGIESLDLVKDMLYHVCALLDGKAFNTVSDFCDIIDDAISDYINAPDELVRSMNEYEYNLATSFVLWGVQRLSPEGKELPARYAGCNITDARILIAYEVSDLSSI